MSTNITTRPELRSVHFASELDVLTFSGVSRPLSLVVSDQSGRTLLENTYTPDADRRVTVYGLDSLLNEATEESPVARIRIEANGEAIGAAPSGLITIIHATVAVGEPAATFLPDFWLTAGAGAARSGVMPTLPGRLEYLTGYFPEPERVTVISTILEPDGTLSEERRERSVSGLVTFDASPVAPEGDGRRLLEYDVVAGGRRASYRVLAHAPGHTRGFLFRNCFGVMETIYCTGLTETKHAIESSWAFIDGRACRYSVSEVEQQTVSTGPLTAAATAVAIDFARSKEVYELVAGLDPGRPMLILESEPVVSNSRSALSSISVTLRPASASGTMLCPVRPVRIFDPTFDSTYE